MTETAIVALIGVVGALGGTLVGALVGAWLAGRNEAKARLHADAKNREDLLKKEYEGERNVLTTRIESLEKLAKDLAEQNGRLSKQLESAYQKVQEIAEKTVESAGQSRSLADLQKLLVEQGRKAAEK